MQNVDLDDLDSEVQIPKDRPDPCACTTQCSKNNFCDVSAACNDAQVRQNSLFGFRYGPKRMPCDRFDVVGEMHQLRIDERTGEVYDPETRKGGARRKKPTRDKKAGEWETHAHTPFGTRRVAIHRGIYQYPYHHYHPIHHYGYLPRYYHVRPHPRNSKKKKRRVYSSSFSSSSYSSSYSS